MYRFSVTVRISDRDVINLLSVHYYIYIFYSPEMVASKRNTKKENKKYTIIKSERTKNQYAL